MRESPKTGKTTYSLQQRNTQVSFKRNIKAIMSKSYVTNIKKVKKTKIKKKHNDTRTRVKHKCDVSELMISKAPRMVSWGRGACKAG